ncbi:MAG TPA: hypothetical protein PKX55_19510, partial [Leptospiraceae bacterium]|nr:hypothetical protein [Leptospiraceae bacterium]
MELDQILFKKAYDLFQRIFQQNSSESHSIVYLKDIKERLTSLSSYLSGKKILIKNAEKEGGYSGN